MADTDLTDNDRKFLEGARARLQAEADQPLVVAVMGQAGVGKSSLINALFDTSLPTDPVRPCTLEPTEITVLSTVAGHPLKFVDLPGLGESATADPPYMEMYRSYIEIADVVIWAIHADSRSHASDVERLRQLAKDCGRFLDKIVFVLTKADTIHADPWIVPLSDALPAQVRVKPGPATTAILAQKSSFAQEAVDLGVSRRADEGPPIACSSLLRYNLAAVMMAVVERLDDLAIRRLTPHLNIDALDRSDPEEVLASAGLMVIDISQRAALRFGDLVTAAIASRASARGSR